MVRQWAFLGIREACYKAGVKASEVVYGKLANYIAGLIILFIFF
jgi:hypothetical protein